MSLTCRLGVIIDCITTVLTLCALLENKSLSLEQEYYLQTKSHLVIRLWLKGLTSHEPGKQKA